jgi:hypothetical protein
MEEQMAPPSSGVSIPPPPLQFKGRAQHVETSEVHKMAMQRYKADRSNNGNLASSWQHHIRVVLVELGICEPSPCTKECEKHCPHLKGAWVEKISTKEAASIILLCEWLAADPKNKSPLGRGVETCYGLKLNGKLIGANCFGRMGGQIGDICGPGYADKTGYLMRGACTPSAPKHAASFFTRQAVRLASKEKGWLIFFAYSDTDAAYEMGTVYQACNWKYLGEDLGRAEGSFHMDFESPDGNRTVTSYALNHDKERKFLRSLGWTEEKGPMRPYLRRLGWKQVNRYGKKKWACFEGTPTEKRLLKSLCRYEFLPYPKRAHTQLVMPARSELVM